MVTTTLSQTRRNTVPEEEWANPSDVEHLARMVCCNLWRGDLDSAATYASILRRVSNVKPALIAGIPRSIRDVFLAACACESEGIQPSPWSPSPSEGSVTVSGSWSSEREMVEAFTSDDSAMDLVTSGRRDRIVKVESRTGDLRIDVEVRCDRRVHVLEFKAGRVEHDAVGQVQKYMRRVGARIQDGTFDAVVGWVVAPEFSLDAAVGLRATGANMLRATPSLSSSPC